MILRVLSRYEESLGGIRQINELSSISLEGTQTQNGQTYDVLIRKREPDSIRFHLMSDDSSVSCGYNGLKGWKQVERGGEKIVEDLNPEELSALIRESRFESPLVRHLEKPENKIELEPSSSIDGDTVYVLLVTEHEELPIRYFLDARTGSIMKKDYLDESGEVTLTTLFRRYKDVEGYRMAHEIENIVREETVSLIRLNSIRVNPGLLSFYFEKPKD